MAKYEELEKVTVLMTREQKRFLDEVAHDIMRYRSANLGSTADLERITANTVIRALITSCTHEHFPELEAMTCEADVVTWMRKIWHR